MRLFGDGYCRSTLPGHKRTLQAQGSVDLARSLAFFACVCLLMQPADHEELTPPKNGPYFSDLVGFIKRHANELVQESTPEHMTGAAIRLDGLLRARFSCCKWTVAVYKIQESKDVVAGFNSGFLDTSGCDLEIPPDLCVTTGGGVQTTAKIETPQSPASSPSSPFALEQQPSHRPEAFEYSIVAFFQPEAESQYYEGIDEDEEPIRVYKTAMEEALEDCIVAFPTPLDLTDMAGCSIQGFVERGLRVPRSVLLTPADHLGWSCAEGGVWRVAMAFSTDGEKIGAIVATALPPMRES